MKISIYLGICILFLITFTTYVKSECTTDCDNGCNSDCSTGCRTNCQTPCKRKCKNTDCKRKCDIREPEELEVQKTKETITATKESDSQIRNVNDIKNDYKVDINPTINLTNTISNINNISVPINVTSVNMNNIHVTSSDSRRSETNITARGGQECSARNPPPNCFRNQKQIVLIPYPQRLPPPSEPKVIVQPIVREPIMVPAPQAAPPPPQRIPIFVPTPVVQQVPVPIQTQVPIPIQTQVPIPIQTQQTFQQIPQYWYVRQPQQTIIAQPQQQVIYPQQPTPCGSPGGQCGVYCMNQGCSGQNQQIIPAPSPIQTPCQRGDCGSRMMYTLTNPYASLNQDSLYGVNSFYSRNTLPQYGAVGSVDTRLSQMGALYGSRNALQWGVTNGGNPNQVPVGVNSYFIPDPNTNFQIQGGNYTEVRRKNE